MLALLPWNADSRGQYVNITSQTGSFPGTLDQTGTSAKRTEASTHAYIHDTPPAQTGRRQKKGMHSAKDAPLHHVNDVSLPGTGSRAKQYLPFFQRGKVSGVVEFVITGHRLKVSRLMFAGTSRRPI